MRDIIIRLHDNGTREVIENGATTDTLTWDEMLGQVATLTFPKDKVMPLYPMHTPERWEEMRLARELRMAERALGINSLGSQAEEKQENTDDGRSNRSNSEKGSS